MFSFRYFHIKSYASKLRESAFEISKKNALPLVCCLLVKQSHISERTVSERRLNSGEQPLYNVDKTHARVVNGEITTTRNYRLSFCLITSNVFLASYFIILIK